jgi:tetratricopeptide (TPR) repeat protein
MVVVSESTRQIVRDRFDFVQLEHLPMLKGFDRPGAAYQLIGENQRNNTGFDANPQASPFVGRADELDLLDTHWAAARHGEMRALLVSGEAGIGKSRLVREFRRRLAVGHHAALECRCDPDHANSAFYPVIRLLLHLFHIRDGDSQKQRHGKLKTAATTMTLPADEIDALAVLLSSEGGQTQDPLQISPEKQRENTLNMLVRCVDYLAGTAPVFLLFEDVQWLDPSSRDFLKLLAFRSVHLPLLLVLTERTELQTRRDPGFPISRLELKGLSAQATLDLIAGACGEFTPSGQSLQLLIDKADGVPLFIEESANMLTDVRNQNGHAHQDALTALQFSIPGKVQDLLMARLDRLAGAKQIAQLGGAIGRRFSLSLLQAVLSHETTPVRIDSLASRLHSLVASGMLVERAEDDDTHYHFKHALMRDAAYQSLWERDRRKFHRAIAVVIGEQFPVLAESQPETLALHFSGAGIGDKAIVYWEKAARLAVSRSAHEESINHLNQGLALLDALPSRTDQDQTELRLQLLLAGQLIATEGYGSNRVGAVYERAAELSLACGDLRAQLRVQLGLEGYHLMRGHFEEAHTIALVAEALVRKSTDRMHGVQARYALANILFHQGDLVSAVAHMDECLADYRTLAHRPGAVQDPGVMCLCYSALAQWELGFPDDALRRAQDVVTLAGQLKHKFSMGQALGFRAMVHYFRGELEQALDWAAQAIAICKAGGFAVWLAHAKLIHGRALAELEDSQAGITEMAEGYAMWSSTGAVVTCAFYLSIQAEALALAGRPDDGLVMLERALTLVSTYSERYYEAEIRRLTGELTLQSAALRGENRDAQAEAWFTGALDAAQSRKLNSLTLRSAMSLGRLWLRQSRPAQAHAVVQAALAAMREGQDTCDLVSARQLLAEIADCSDEV